MRLSLIGLVKTMTFFPDQAPSVRYRPSDRGWAERSAKQHYGGGCSASYSMTLQEDGQWHVIRHAFSKVEEFKVCILKDKELALRVIDLCVERDLQFHLQLIEGDYPDGLLAQIYMDAKEACNANS